MDQPIAIELVPTADRACVMLVMRSNQAIDIRMATQTLATFVEMLKEKYPTSKIELPSKKLVTP